MWWHDIKEIREWMVTISSRLTDIQLNPIFHINPILYKNCEIDLKKYEDAFSTPEKLKQAAREYTKKDIQAYKDSNIPDEVTRRARKVQRIKDDVVKQGMSGAAFGLNDAVNSNRQDNSYKIGGKVTTAGKNPKHKGCW